MKLRPLILCLSWIVPLSLCAQSTVQERLQQALTFENQGYYAQALGLLQPIEEAGKLCTSEADRVWTYIGYAHQEQGDFEGARQAYERAVELARTLPTSAGDYPTALDNLADLDQAEGDFRSASRLERNALRLFQKSGNHAGAAWAYTHLAVIELTRRHEQNASRYLQRAAREAQSAPQLGGEYYASLASGNAWLAELEDDPQTAIVEYRRSIASEPCRNCVLTGWRNILLGKAYAESGDLVRAQKAMQAGLAILANTAGEHAPKYLTAELAYSHVLDETGAHRQAAALKASTEKELSMLDSVRCGTCVELKDIP